MDYHHVKIRVVFHFLAIQAQAHHFRLGVPGGPVGAPTAHQVEHHGIGRDQFPEETAHGGDGPVVDVHHLARLQVEEAVVLFIHALEILG